MTNPPKQGFVLVRAGVGGASEGPCTRVVVTDSQFGVQSRSGKVCVVWEPALSIIFSVVL